MGLINPTYHDRVKYTLSHKEHGSLVITEPIGWRSDEKEYARNKKYHGIFAKFSNSLKFIADGAEFIKLIKDVYDINAEIRLTRDEKHPHTDEWIRSYDGVLDLSTYVLENRQVSVKFNSEGLEKLLKSRESEKVEIERLDTLDGNSLSPLTTKKVVFDGRRIFLESTYDIKDSDNSSYLYNQTNGNTRGSTVSVPLNLAYKSHDSAVSAVANTSIGDNSHERNASGDIGLMFFINSDKNRTLKIKFHISFTVKVLNYDDINWSMYRLRLATYNNGSDFAYKNTINLFETRDINTLNNKTLNFSFDQTINLLEGESLSLQFTQLMDGRNGHSAHFETDMQNIVCDMVIEEDSDFVQTTSKTILAHELGDRLLTIATGKKNSFYSDALGRTDIGYNTDGIASLTGFTHGFWIRGFDKLPESDKNKYKGFTTSFKDYMESLTAVWNMGLGIERIGFKERARVEKKEYFYNNNVTIKLPNQVKKVKRSVAKEYYYSGLEFGYVKGGEYEEAMGLDEYNATSTFTTSITRLKKIFRMVSVYRSDPYGIEFTRRKPKSEFPTEDNRSDKDIFMLDLKRWQGNTFRQRKWEDDFEKKPTGIFSPETATNLRFSPFNVMLRHGWVIASGLTKYINDYVRYGSSTANSGLKTKLRGGNEYAENKNIKNSQLPRPRYLPEWIEFEHIVDFEVMQQIEGTTNILGKTIPNVNGLVEFVNEDNEIEKGFLFNVKPNGSGKWKLLKANR
ncbi:hypothetical protein [Aquimarina macrocephali]|uniref:hypothetical protein n=1 Tax=Aquimarina macrocephali TaxID=666563 RepID=UPI003F67E9C7